MTFYCRFGHYHQLRCPLGTSDETRVPNPTPPPLLDQLSPPTIMLHQTGGGGLFRPSRFNIVMLSLRRSGRAHIILVQEPILYISTQKPRYPLCRGFTLSRYPCGLLISTIVFVWSQYDGGNFEQRIKTKTKKPN